MFKINANIKFFIVLLIAFSFFAADISPELIAKSKSRAKVKVSKSKTKAKSSKLSSSKKKTSLSKSAKKKKKKRKKRRRSRRPPFRDTKLTLSTIPQILSDSVLASGVRYRTYTLGAKYKHFIHTLEIDLDSSEAKASVIKAGENIDALVKLQQMAIDYSNEHKSKVLGLINANFWRAGSNLPIGPVATGGELVEMLSYKEWSSAFIDTSGKMHIDNFKMSGNIQTSSGNKITIRSLNHRRDSLGLVIYNKFGGDSIPYIPLNNVSKEINKAIEEAENNIDENDSTEEEIDTNLIRSEIIAQKREAQIENQLYKMTIQYMEPPIINKEFKCRVISVNKGSVPVPKGSCIVSFGRDYPLEMIPKIGEIVLLKYETNSHEDLLFSDAVCGTPRLVRNGNAKHEAMFEGSRGRRFISWQLPRTAIGTSKNKNKIILATVEGTGLHLNCYGANLNQLSLIMKLLGCSDAMNLDGGGSTIMTVNGNNVLHKNKPEHSRRLSVGIGPVIK